MSLEKNAWEAFEAGSYEEVFSLYSKNPENAFLSDLNWISEKIYLDNSENYISRGSNLKELILSLQLKTQGREKEALKYFLLYIKNPENPLCYSIYEFGINLAYFSDSYEACLYIISRDQKREYEQSFYREKMKSLFALGKYAEVVQFFKQIFEWAKDDSEIFLRTGLSLQLMGRYKEAEAILSRSPGVSALPSFEERHQEFAEKIEKISSFEKRNDLSFDEMRDLGFAYLFNSDFTKAEEVFKKASLALK